MGWRNGEYPIVADFFRQLRPNLKEFSLSR